MRFPLSFRAVRPGFWQSEIGAEGGVGCLPWGVRGIGGEEDLVAAVVDGVVEGYGGGAALLGGGERGSLVVVGAAPSGEGGAELGSGVGGEAGGRVGGELVGEGDGDLL